MSRCAVLFAGGVIASFTSFAQLSGPFVTSLDHPAIEYATRPAQNAVSELNRKIQSDQIQLPFDRVNGYLRSTLEALDIPIESQMAVFSKTSLQMRIINPSNPRTIFFNDTVTVAWVRGEPFVEVAAADSRQGVIFYTLDQDLADKPAFTRRDSCLSCHESYSSLGVPGMLLRSVFTAPNGDPMRQFGDYISDHRSPLEERWGGWYVTGKAGSARHLGNAMVTDNDKPESMVTAETLNLESLKGKFDPYAYLSDHSDIVAQMVFAHQMHMTNLLTRIGWETRFALYPGSKSELAPLLRDAAKELVDYLLFIDEAPLTGKIRGTSGYTEKFAAKGPRDSKGRSLRSFDLERRLMRYPCSYMIYAAPFDGLPAEAKEAIYKRMWEILSGTEKSAKYARLTLADRQAIVEILRETKKDLPAYFQPVMH